MAARIHMRSEATTRRANCSPRSAGSVTFALPGAAPAAAAAAAAGAGAFGAGFPVDDDEGFFAALTTSATSSSASTQRTSAAARGVVEAARDPAMPAARRDTRRPDGWFINHETHPR